MSAEQGNSNPRNKRRSASNSEIPCDSINSCRYNIADFQNCKLVLFNENLPPGSQVNVLSYFEKKTLAENKCNRNTLLLSETENRINTQSPKKSDSVNLRVTRSRNSDVSVPLSPGIGSEISSSTELKSTEKVKTNQNNIAQKKICTRELVQPIDNRNSFEIAKSSVPRKTSDAICISPKTKKRLSSKDVKRVSFCDSDNSSSKVTEKERPSILKTTNEKDKISAQPNVQNVNGDISEEVIVPANCQNPNLRLGENLVENNRIQVSCNNQFSSKYRVKKSNVQLSVVTSFLSYTVLDNNLPSGSTEDLHLDLSTVPPSDCSENINSLLDQSIKKECESHVDNENDCGNVNTSANHKNQTISTDVFIEPSLSDRNQSLPLRINSAEYVKRFPRNRSKVAAENSGSEDNPRSKLSRLSNLSNSVTSTKKVTKRNILNSNSKLGTTSTCTHVKETSIDTSLGTRDDAITVLKETEQSTESVPVVEVQKVLRKRGRPLKKRRASPTHHNNQNALLPPNSTKLPVQHNVSDTTVSQHGSNSSLTNCEDDVYTILLQKYSDLLECNLSPRVYLNRLETSRCLKRDPEPSTSQQIQGHIDVNLTSEINIKSDPESSEETDWPYNNNMSPLYIKMRPEDNVTVDMRDLTSTEKLIMLDIASSVNHSGTDSSGSAQEYVVRRCNVPQHDNDEDMQTVCVSHNPSSSNELHDKSDGNGDSGEMCNSHTSVKATKTIVNSIRDTCENVVKCSDAIVNCDTSQIVTSQYNSECVDLNRSLAHNTTACRIQSPDSSTAVNGLSKDKPQKLELSKVKLREAQKLKTKSKFNVHNFVKSVLPNKSCMVQEISGHSNITENTLSNIDSEKETCNSTNIDTKSRRKVRNGRYSIEGKTNLPHREQNILENTKTHGEPVINDPENNIKTTKRCRNSLKRNKVTVNSEEQCETQSVKSHEETSKNSTEKRAKSKTKRETNSIHTTEPVVPEEPKSTAGVRKSVDKEEKTSSKDTNNSEETSINRSKKKFKQKSNHRMTQNDEPSVSEQSCIVENVTKLENVTILERVKSSKETHTSHSKKETKSKLKAKTNVDNNENAVSEKSRTANVADKSLLEDVEYPEDTHVSHSRRKSTSKHRSNYVESYEPMEPAVPVNVMKSVDKKKKKNKSFSEKVSKKKTEPKLKWKMKLGKHVLTRASRKHLFEDTSDEEENSVFENKESKLPIKSTTEVSSILGDNEKFHKKNIEQELVLKTKDVPKKTDKEDMIQKDVDNKHGRKAEIKLNKKIRLDENKQNTVSTEHVVVKSTSKLADKKQSSEFENVESKLSVNPFSTQVTSKVEDNRKFNEKNNEQLAPSSKDIQKKTDKKDIIQKDLDKKNITVKKVIKKPKQIIKLEENKQTTVPTEYCGIKTTSKLADEKQSSEFENLEPKLPTVPDTTEKLKRIPKLSEKCETNLENKEESAPPEESEVERNLKKADEHENSALKKLKLSEKWNVHPISPILMTTETLEKRLADAGFIAPLNKNPYSDLRRRAAQLPRIFNDESKLQEISQTFFFDDRNSNGKALVNPLANASEPFGSDENKPSEYLAALGSNKLPDKKVPSTNMDSQETTKPNRQIGFDTNKETTTARDPFIVEGITKIMPNTENTASKNVMLSREADLPTPFLVPSVPPRKRIRITMNTNVEKTLPSKNNTDYDACEDGMEKKMEDTSEECSAKNKHSFNFVDMSVTPTETKRTQKVKIKRPEMSDILTKNVQRKPLEDDTISIYADSICNDGIYLKKNFDLDDKDKEISHLDPNAVISEWIRDTSGHAADNASPQNSDNKQIEERFRPFKYSRINYKMFAEDEELSPLNNRVIDQIDMAQNTNKRPCLSFTQNTVAKSHNLDTLYLFNDLCKNVMEYGICKRYRCAYQHSLPIDWENTLQNMPKESLRNLYNNTKREMNLYVFKKIFPIVAKQLGFQRDYNSVISLVKDVLEINIDSDRTPYINAIIDALRNIGLTFNSVIEVIFNSAFVARNLKELLTDILINICVEQGDIENSWSTMQLLMKYRNYHVDAGIIKTILRKCLKKSKLQKELCLKVYSDLISCISDDKLGIIFQSLLNDYIECMRTLGLSNEAQTLYERTAALSVQSSGSSLYIPTGSVRSKFVSEVSPNSILPLFDIKFPYPPKLQSSPTFPQNAAHNSSPNCNAPYRRPIVNKVMPWNNSPDLLLKDALADKPSNVPSTSATVAPYVEEMPPFSMSTVRQAIFTENLSQLMSLILEYKEGDLTDQFLKTCLDAIQESAHNFAVLFRNLCQSVIVFQNKHDVKMDKSLEYVFKTIGTNLIIYSTHVNKWEQAYHIYQTLRDLYSESDILNVKMLMVDKPSYIKRLLILCRVFIKKDDCRHAWEFFKGNSLHTSSSWTELADQQDIQYRDLVFTELMTGLNKGKQWQTAFTIIEYILKQNINELDPIVDTTIQMAVKNDCHVEYITSFMSICPVWYNRIHCHTFRVIVVKLVRDHMYKMALTVYRQGCEMEIYPHLFGNEKCLEFSTHYVLEEILLMLNVFLQNMVNFIPIRHTVVIKVQQSTEVTDETRTELPSLLFQHNMSCETMHVRIVNILNNYIRPPIRVVNKYSQLEITPAELEKHLQVRRKWNQF